MREFCTALFLRAADENLRRVGCAGSYDFRDQVVAVLQIEQLAVARSDAFQHMIERGILLFA